MSQQCIFLQQYVVKEIRRCKVHRRYTASSFVGFTRAWMDSAFYLTSHDRVECLVSGVNTMRQPLSEDSNFKDTACRETSVAANRSLKASSLQILTLPICVKALLRAGRVVAQTMRRLFLMQTSFCQHSMIQRLQTFIERRRLRAIV